MQNMAESQVKRMKQRKRGKDRLEEAKRNIGKHELEIAKLYAKALASIHQTANHNQLSLFHAPQGTMIPMQSPTELNSPGLTPPHSSTPQSNPRNGFVNELNVERLLIWHCLRRGKQKNNKIVYIKT